jgi:hypothetical protein
MREVPIASVDPSTPGQFMQPKIDGAHAYVVLEGGRPPRVFSYRTAKNKTGLIEHTHKFPDWWKSTPGPLKTTVLRAEVFARDRKGKVAPSQVTGGLLNATVSHSRQKQQEQGLQLDLRTLKAVRFEGRDRSSEPFGLHERFLKAIARRDPRMKPVPTARTKKEKTHLLSAIRSGRYPLTHEGVVLRDPSGTAAKAKERPDFDVYVRGVVPGKRKGEMGAIRYSMTPEGRILGTVGTGFSRMQRKTMLRHPSRFVGRVAKVMSQGPFPSGALRAPVFTGEWHLDKGRQPVVENV